MLARFCATQIIADDGRRQSLVSNHPVLDGVTDINQAGSFAWAFVHTRRNSGSLIFGHREKQCVGRDLAVDVYVQPATVLLNL